MANTVELKIKISFDETQKKVLKFGTEEERVAALAAGPAVRPGPSGEGGAGGRRTRPERSA